MKKKISKVINGFMVAAASVTTVGGVLTTVPVQAAEPTNQSRNSGDYMVNKGVVDFGEGTANITIKGNAGQSLVGKRFEVFQLFNAENAKGNESINYTFKDKYATALKTVVASALNKRDGSSLKPDDVTEYMVIDYIQTLNHDQVEGAQAAQELEGRYSAFRYFVENVRTEIKKEELSGDYVYVQGTTADNSVTLQGLQYGYYIVDEVSEHDEDDSDYFASSLCMVDTANPTASINIKSDYPSIIKKIKEDDNQDTIGNKGWNDVADYEIGQTVPYKYESTICDMNGYSSYYYAWHDKMDKALTFHNTDVEDAGYAINSSFVISSDTNNAAFITLAIGEDEGDKLLEQYDNVIVKQYYQITSSFGGDIIKDPEANKEAAKGAAKERPTTSQKEENDEKSEKQTVAKKKEKTEKQNATKKTVDDHILMIVPLLIIACIVAAILYLLRKKNKI